MLGPTLTQELVQSVSVSHLIAGWSRASLLLLAAPESGKTTIAVAAKCNHVVPISVISGRSVVAEMKNQPHMEYMLFNDLTCLRALSHQASALLVVILNQATQNEHGLVTFAGKPSEKIDRQIGIIGCIPFETFTNHRSKWKEMGFISRMIPFSYSYSKELVAEIKDGIDMGNKHNMSQPNRKMKAKWRVKQYEIQCDPIFIKKIRTTADAKSVELGQLGVRLLNNYHAIIRAHALVEHRSKVIQKDVDFLCAVDSYVSTKECKSL